MAYLGTPIDTTNQFQSLQGKRFSGDGSTTAFTLDIAPSSVFDIEVFVENVRQDPNSAYSINGTTLTFTGAPSSGTNNIYVVHQAKAVGTIDVPASSVVPASLASNIISGQTALAAVPAATDELLISDAGTIKRIDAQFFQNTPAFFARLSSDQTISSDTSTKIQVDSEVFDSDGTYDNSSNYRFTPAVAGKYFVFAGVRFDNQNSQATMRAELKFNGSVIGSNFLAANDSSSNRDYTVTVSCLQTFDDNDYMELFAQSDLSGNQTINGASTNKTYFGAYKIIGV